MNDGFKINIQGVSDTSNTLNTKNQNFKDYVDTLYSTINTAKTNAWQGPEAEQYYASIMAYKAKLEEISAEIDSWKLKTSHIADNFTAASSKISSNINNL